MNPGPGTRSESPPTARSIPAGRRWLLLMHQLPPKPDYFRVKIWRRLQRIGAVAIRNSVYILPRSDAAVEQFQWTLREITAGGGEGSICEAAFVDGLSDGQIETLFRSAREADYGALSEEIALLARRASPRVDGELHTELEAATLRLSRRMMEIGAIDFVATPGRQHAATALERLQARLRAADGNSPAPKLQPEAKRRTNQVWVTRRGVHVDRIASAWLIRRFIDPKARIRFIDEGPPGDRPRAGELRFDMFEGEYTHEGDRCTFEVLLERFHLDQPALRAIAEMVHDIDLQEGRYGRPETPGFERLINGITQGTAEDAERLSQGAVLLEGFYRAFGRDGAPLRYQPPKR